MLQGPGLQAAVGSHQGQPGHRRRDTRQVEFARLLFPDFSLIACGFLLCRYTALDRSVWEKVDSLVYYFLFPVLLFQSIVRSPLDLGEASSMMAAGLLLGMAGIGLAYLLPYLPGLRGRIDPREHAGAAQVAFRFNSYIALALSERLAGAAGVQLIAVLIGVCVPLFNVAAVWPMARHAQTGFLAALVRNPLIIATAVGLTANLAGLAVPGWLEPTVARIGGSSIPLGLMAAGAGMRLGSLARSKLLTVSLLAIRHAANPLVAWSLVRLLRLEPAQASVLLIFSAMPTAASCYVLTSRMGYNGGYVAGLVTLSTVLGIASLSFALGVLR
ncbi:AEC family transporter [Ramlibacter sp. MAH-25]|uniref:AEC family transporter n=1 Tax=Ramlibacter pinisoli TaxID=2682844 RepID=A0A6N8IPT2_9BURK|nr:MULTISPECIES: AEC family transporter [Ramlibacter]MBA2963765.1 AEC family transporter [Ramlibacter sp. CGMCC 1.13660]MVQ28732.1 AEC family transporter [Ramlibacter pinisoli]